MLDAFHNEQRKARHNVRILHTVMNTPRSFQAKPWLWARRMSIANIAPPR
jgi:hypothetical protein